MSDFKVECGACGGTGLYQGFMEERGYPVVCVRCNGSGAGNGSKPYTGRKEKSGVKGVRINPTGMIMSGGSRQTMSYDAFKRKYPEG